MSAAEPNAADLAAICRRLDRHEPRATDAEGFKSLVEGAAAAGQIRRLARGGPALRAGRAPHRGAPAPGLRASRPRAALNP